MCGGRRYPTLALLSTAAVLRLSISTADTLRTDDGQLRSRSAANCTKDTRRQSPNNAPSPKLLGASREGNPKLLGKNTYERVSCIVRRRAILADDAKNSYSSRVANVLAHVPCAPLCFPLQAQSSINTRTQYPNRIAKRARIARRLGLSRAAQPVQAWTRPNKRRETRNQRRVTRK